jgi:hypothetical protein
VQLALLVVVVAAVAVVEDRTAVRRRSCAGVDTAVKRSVRGCACACGCWCWCHLACACAVTGDAAASLRHRSKLVLVCAIELLLSGRDSTASQLSRRGGRSSLRPSSRMTCSGA